MENGRETNLAELIHRIATNPMDEDALDLLINEKYDHFSRYVYKISSKFSKEDVEDIVAITISNIWRYAASFRGKTNSDANAWMLAITRNLAITWGKAQDNIREHTFTPNKDSQENIFLDTWIDQIPDEEVIDPDSTIDHRRGLKELRESLTTRQREVFDLLGENFNATEIARLLKISSGAVSQTIDALMKKGLEFFDDAEVKERKRVQRATKKNKHHLEN